MMSGTRLQQFANHHGAGPVLGLYGGQLLCYTTACAHLNNRDLILMHKLCSR